MFPIDSPATWSQVEWYCRYHHYITRETYCRLPQCWFPSWFQGYFRMDVQQCRWSYGEYVHYSRFYHRVSPWQSDRSWAETKVFDHLWFSCWDRGTYWTTYGGWLLPYPDWTANCLWGRSVDQGNLQPGGCPPHAPRNSQAVCYDPGNLGSGVCKGWVHHNVYQDWEKV